MMKPGIVTIQTKSIRNDRTYEEYCQSLNELIHALSIQRGKVGNSSFRTETVNIYQDELIRCTYCDNEFGNDRYYLEINSEYWNKLPAAVPRALIYEDGWNLVYAYQDSPGRQVILHHIPGDWDHLLTRYQ